MFFHKVVKRLCRLFFDITLYQTLYYVGDILTCVFIEHEVHNICRITAFAVVGLILKNILEWVRNELRQSYLRLFVQVEIILSIFRFSSSDTPTVKHQRAYETAC